MAISVTSIGSNAQIATSVAVTVGAGGVPSGSLIFVCVQDTTSGLTNGTLADTAGNTYTLAGSKSPNNSSANGKAQLFYAWNSAAFSSGDTITYTGTSGTTSKTVSAAYATGIDTSADPLDTITTASASNATPTITSAAPSVAGELFVVFFGRNNPTGAVFTQDTAHGWAAPPVSAHEGSGTLHSGVDGGSQVNAGTSALTYSPTFNTSANTGTVMASFKPAVAGSTFSMAGTGAASFTGSSLASGTLSSSGTGALSAVGASQASGTLTSAGLGAASFIGASLFGGVLTSAGAAVAAFIGNSISGGGSILTAVGSGVASFVGAAITKASLVASGVGAFAGIGASSASGTATMAGSSATSLIGAVPGSEGALAATGSATASFVGKAETGRLLSVPFRDGARFADGAGFRQFSESRFVHARTPGNVWGELSSDGDPWTPAADGADLWSDAA